jgi:cytochrome c biogenesis protein CcmG, thiol:disulfide interchange protein DsbE
LIPHVDANQTLRVGQAAPDFDLPLVSGGSVKLSDLKGKPVVLNFWASWCSPCRKEMPDLQAITDKYKDAGLQVYGINLGESKVAVSGYLADLGVSFPALLDQEDKVQTAYKILPIPATFFIDRTGLIRAIYPMQMSRQQMEAEALSILSK